MSLTIANIDVKRILVDNGSFADVLYYDTFQKMSMPSIQLQPISALLVGFIESSVPVEGAISLPETVDTKPQQKILRLTFLVLKVPFAYNTIVGRSGLNAFRAVVSTYHLKYPTPYRVGKI